MAKDSVVAQEGKPATRHSGQWREALYCRFGSRSAGISRRPIAAIEGIRAMHPGVSGIFVENRANGASVVFVVTNKKHG